MNFVPLQINRSCRHLNLYSVWAVYGVSNVAIFDNVQYNMCDVSHICDNCHMCDIHLMYAINVIMQ